MSNSSISRPTQSIHLPRGFIQEQKRFRNVLFLFLPALIFLAMILLVQGWYLFRQNDKYVTNRFFLANLLVILGTLSIIIIIIEGFFIRQTQRYTINRIEKKYNISHDWKNVNKLYPTFDERLTKYGWISSITYHPSMINAYVIDTINSILKSENIQYNVLNKEKKINIFRLSYFDAFFINSEKDDIVIGLRCVKYDRVNGTGIVAISYGQTNRAPKLIETMAKQIDDKMLS